MKKFITFNKINQIYVVIGNDDILQWDHRENIIFALLKSNLIFNYKLIDYIAFERKLKLKKINND